MDSIPRVLRDQYKSDFHLADAGFYRGRVEETTKNREKYWDRWVAYVAPMGLDPYLQKTNYTISARLLSGFAARVRTGAYGRGKQITVGAVSSAITAVGTAIALVTGVNPIKLAHSDKLIPRLSQMMEGWKKTDPPTIKKLPVEADVPELLSHIGSLPFSNELDRAIGDLALIAFYYLLRVGEYTIKNSRNTSKQTVQFRLGDVTFFKRDSTGKLRQLSRGAPIAHIMSARSATLKLDNQKNGWKGVCVHQQQNGEPIHCPVRALGRRVAHIRQHAPHQDTLLSSFFVKHTRFDVTDNDMRTSIKRAADMLQYPLNKGIPIARIDTHSFRSGGANALSLSGYSDREIQKMGRWRSATFKEYIREELHCFSHGMSRKMKQKFNFVNISGGVFHDVTPYVITQPYQEPPIVPDY